MLWETLPTLTWHASSCSQQPPRGPHQWLLLGRLNNPLACFILQPTGTPRPHIHGFFWASKLGMLHPAANSHPEATHQWLLLGRLNNPLACFILQPTGTPRPHIHGFFWASKPAVCQPLNPPNAPNP